MLYERSLLTGTGTAANNKRSVSLDRTPQAGEVCFDGNALPVRGNVALNGGVGGVAGELDADRSGLRGMLENSKWIGWRSRWV